jgi:hypothetical protein
VPPAVIVRERCMGSFLQVLGALVLVFFLLILVLGVVAWLVIRARIRRALASLADLQSTLLPPRIHLYREHDPFWKEKSRVQSLVEPLVALGFEAAGTYGIEEMEGVRLEALVKPEEGVYGAVYEHERAGTWIDLVSLYQDGTSLTYSTAPHGSTLDQRPGHGKLYMPELDPSALYERMLAERPRHALARVSTSEFPAAFEKAYADEMDWRNSRGGLTEEEIRSIAESSGRETSEELIAATREAMAQNALASLEESLREHFLAETSIPAAEWEAIRERVIVVHDRLTREMVEDLVYERIDEDTDLPEAPWDTSTPREAFAVLNERLPAEERFQKLGEVREPVEADVYCAPG